MYIVKDNSKIQIMSLYVGVCVPNPVRLHSNTVFISHTKYCYVLRRLPNVINRHKVLDPCDVVNTLHVFTHNRGLDGGPGFFKNTTMSLRSNQDK